MMTTGKQLPSEHFADYSCSTESLEIKRLPLSLGGTYEKVGLAPLGAFTEVVTTPQR